MEPLIRPLSWGNVILSKQTVQSVLLALLYLTISALGLREYIEWSGINFIIGVAVMPVMLSVKRTGKRNCRFALLAFFLMTAGIFIPVKTALYLALCAVFLFLYECHGKRLTALPMLTLFMISPVCQYFTHIFSFPIRLWLTDVAGSILKHADETVVVSGNIISFGKGEFSVDPACMGLNMLITSLLCGLIMLAVYQRKNAVVLGLHWVSASLMLLFLLNIVANLARILLLVYFKILPEHAMHGFTGIVCLFVYVILPASYILKWAVVRWGKPTDQELNRPEARLLPLKYIHYLLLPMFAILSFNIYSKGGELPKGKLPLMKNWHVSWYDKEVIKLENGKALVYIKPLQGFVYTDHNPLICWTGSGYTFKNVQQQQWAGLPLFTGVLRRGNEQLFTAWWYDNGSTATINQWVWRWQMFQGKRAFSIINVTANDMETLKKEVAAMIDQRSYIFPK